MKESKTFSENKQNVIDEIEKKDNRQKFIEIYGEEALKNLGPKRKFQLGLLNTPNQWRIGYTKPTLEKRKEKRRKKNKMARMARKTNR